MKKIILITIFFSSVSLSQTQQFETTFTFTDEFTNSQELVLGYDPFGTDGLDIQLGEAVVPQVPPGQFGVRFQLPTDTSLYTLKDIRFGCGQPFYYEHLFDLSYTAGSSIINIDWEWSFELYMIYIKDPYTGQNLATLEEYFDSSYYSIPVSMGKIILGIQYNGPLTWPEYHLLTPNGNDTLAGGEYYNITWSTNWYMQSAKLEYSSDAGNTWNDIIDSLPPSPNANYLWLVPYINSDSCLVRVGDYPCYYDQSDDYFTITYPVTVGNEKNLPTEFLLSQNYPNPFNPSTTIYYQIPQLEFVTLKVYDILGREIVTLVNEEKPSGEYEVEFNGNNLPSGVYFYQLKAGSLIETKKMVLLK